MKIKVIIGLTIAAIAFIFIMFKQYDDINTLKEEAAQTKELLDNRDKQKTEKPIVEITETPLPSIDQLDHNHGHIHDIPHDHSTLASQTSIENQEMPKAIVVQDLLDTHPAYTEQAIADQKALSDYDKAYKEYHDKYQELNKELQLLTKEHFKLVHMPLDEIAKMSRSEKEQYRDDLLELRRKQKAHYKKRDKHEETKPIYPQAAADRMEKLNSTMPNTFNHATNQWETR